MLAVLVFCTFSSTSAQHLRRLDISSSKQGPYLPYSGGWWGGLKANICANAGEGHYEYAYCRNCHYCKCIPERVKPGCTMKWSDKPGLETKCYTAVCDTVEKLPKDCTAYTDGCNRCSHNPITGQSVCTQRYCQEKGVVKCLKRANDDGDFNSNTAVGAASALSIDKSSLRSFGTHVYNVGGDCTLGSADCLTGLQCVRDSFGRDSTSGVCSFASCAACVGSGGRWTGGISGTCYETFNIMDISTAYTLGGCARAEAMDKANCQQYTDCTACASTEGSLCGWSPWNGKCVKNNNGMMLLARSPERCEGVF